MIQHRDNWPTGSRFSARLAAVERTLRRATLNATQRNTALLDTLEALIGLDVWDGLLHPDDVAARFRADFAGASERIGLRSDSSLPVRLARLRDAASETYRPPE